MTFSPTAEQRVVIESSASAVVIAGPGRGKTSTAIAAADRWATVQPSKRVLFTSFSNSAVRRIAQAAGIGGVFRRSLDFRTFHSVAFEILADYGRFVGLQRPAKALDRPGEHLVALEEQWPDERAAYAEARRAHALKTGLVSFDDMVPFAVMLLDASPTLRRTVQRRYGCVIIDEFQDTRTEQAAFLQLIGGEARLLAFGDPHQMVYEHDFTTASTRFETMAAWKGEAVTTFSGRNYRCAATDILDFAEAVLNGDRFIGGHANVWWKGVYEKQRRFNVALRCQSIWKTAPGSSIGIISPNARIGRDLGAELRMPAKGVKAAIPVRAVIEVDANWAEAFRMAALASSDYAREPSNSHCRQLAVALTSLEGETRRSTGSPLARLAATERLLSSTSRKVSALRDFLAAPPDADIQVFATRLVGALVADKTFEAVGHMIEKTGIPSVKAVGAVEQFEAYRSSRSAVNLHGHDWSPSRTTLLTMQRAKGREFDHVIVIADPHAHRKQAPLSELRRLHYVACTRARQSLFVLWNSSEIGDVLGPVLHLN